MQAINETCHCSKNFIVLSFILPSTGLGHSSYISAIVLAGLSEKLSKIWHFQLKYFLNRTVVYKQGR